jgi:hypothetical protein
MKVAVNRRSSRRALVMACYNATKSRKIFVLPVLCFCAFLWLITRRALLERDHVVVGFVDLVEQLLDL